ncbi:MAG: putative metal-dependent phosphoesterase TrpH, partial [Myxococcota bacterium]
MKRMLNLDLKEDMHVHSTWSDGKDTLEANIAMAGQRGLRRLACVDHVRADTSWVGAFRDAV